MAQGVHQVKVLIEGDRGDVILPPKTAQRKRRPACLGDADRYDGRQFWICPEHSLCLLFRLAKTEGALRLSYQLDARKSAFQCLRENLGSCRGAQHIRVIAKQCNSAMVFQQPRNIGSGEFTCRLIVI